MNTIIRPYESQDLKPLLSVWRKASELAHPFLDSAFLDKETENIPNIYLPIAETWVAEVNHELVGFIALINNEVGALFVDPVYHGKGIGTALMNKAADIRDSLELEVFKDNSIGRAFYARYGFTCLKESVHDQSGFDVLRLHYAPKKEQ